MNYDWVYYLLAFLIFIVCLILAFSSNLIFIYFFSSVALWVFAYVFALLLLLPSLLSINSMYWWACLCIHLQYRSLSKHAPFFLLCRCDYCYYYSNFELQIIRCFFHFDQSRNWLTFDGIENSRCDVFKVSLKTLCVLLRCYQSSKSKCV